MPAAISHSFIDLGEYIALCTEERPYCAGLGVAYAMTAVAAGVRAACLRSSRNFAVRPRRRLLAFQLAACVLAAGRAATYVTDVFADCVQGGTNAPGLAPAFAPWVDVCLLLDIAIHAWWASVIFEHASDPPWFGYLPGSGTEPAGAHAPPPWSKPARIVAQIPRGAFLATLIGGAAALIVLSLLSVDARTAVDAPYFQRALEGVFAIAMMIVAAAHAGSAGALASDALRDRDVTVQAEDVARSLRGDFDALESSRAGGSDDRGSRSAIAPRSAASVGSEQSRLLSPTLAASLLPLRARTGALERVLSSTAALPKRMLLTRATVVGGSVVAAATLLARAALLLVATGYYGVSLSAFMETHRAYDVPVAFYVLFVHCALELACVNALSALLFRTHEPNSHAFQRMLAKPGGAAEAGLGLAFGAPGRRGSLDAATSMSMMTAASGGDGGDGGGGLRGILPRGGVGIPFERQVAILTSALESSAEDCVIDAREIEVDLVTKISAGGEGQIFMGWFQGAAVALKELYINAFNISDEETHLASLGKFSHEAAILRTLSHPNVVTFYGITARFDQRATAGDLCMPRLFLVEELCACALKDVIEAEAPPLSLLALLDLALQICGGMCYLHSKQIVHRDLNPSNVVLSASGAKLCDFGLARTVVTRQRDAGAIARHREAKSDLGELASAGYGDAHVPFFSPQRISSALGFGRRLGRGGAAEAAAKAQSEAELAHEGGTPGYTAPEVVEAQLAARTLLRQRRGIVRSPRAVRSPAAGGAEDVAELEVDPTTPVMGSCSRRVSRLQTLGRRSVSSTAARSRSLLVTSTTRSAKVLRAALSDVERLEMLYQADVFSFGSVVWQMITRRRPFEELTKRKFGETFSLEDFNGTVLDAARPRIPYSSKLCPDALGDLIAACWSRRAMDRPSFREMRSELERIRDEARAQQREDGGGEGGGGGGGDAMPISDFADNFAVIQRTEWWRKRKTAVERSVREAR